MAGIDLQSALYYQYLINNNSSSTMLNAISGNSSSSDSLSAISSISGLSGLYGDYSSLSGLTGVDSGSSVNSFANVLESYLSKTNDTNSLSLDTDNDEQLFSMTEKLADVLEKAKDTEDTSSLTYKTVQEIYDYFSGQVSQKAAALLGNIYDNVNTETSTENSSASQTTDIDKVNIDDMNAKALRGEEMDFSGYDEVVDNAFAENISNKI